ncbi:MAG: HNH endonuclease [Planctomycetaceae bacterium]|nr:HNH endonuclease [Planctomycetaceae bacterium]
MTRKHKFQNTLYTHDNLCVLSGLNSGLVDLIYLDPPFNTKRTYSASVGSRAAGTSFKDMWTWQDVNEHYLDTLAVKFPELTKYIATVGGIHGKAMMAYLTYMAQRIIEMHRILKDTGSLYLHCDPTASHYLKSLLDGIFGKNNFRNEIVWCYQTAGKGKSSFAKKHDIIFLYSKTREYIFNTEGASIPRRTKNHLRTNIDENERIYQEKTDRATGKVYRWYNDKGQILEDYWTDINALNRSEKERVGYPTQKPLALLHRIIKTSSKEGNIVMDPFCGCATTCVAAQQLGRKWIGIDIENQAVGILVERLSDDAGLFKDFIATEQIPKRTDIKEVLPSESVKQRLYKEQNGKCNACGHDFEIWNLELDHIIPSTKGGGDYYENYQLLCASCNRIKGDRPMEYLRLKIETREKMMKTKIIFGE